MKKVSELSETQIMLLLLALFSLVSIITANYSHKATLPLACNAPNAMLFKFSAEDGYIELPYLEGGKTTMIHVYSDYNDRLFAYLPEDTQNPVARVDFRYEDHGYLPGGIDMLERFYVADCGVGKVAVIDTLKFRVPLTPTPTALNFTP